MSEPTEQATPIEDDHLYPAERVKAFADAVVAIAMTLLILPLMESVTDTAEAESSAGNWFTDHGQQLISFALSFVIIAMFWISHHRLFSRVERVSTGLIWLLMAWLLTIVWLPVATAMSGQMSSDDALVKVVYIGSMVLTALVSLAVRLYLRAHPVLHHIPRSGIAAGIAADVSMAVLFALSLVMTVVVPAPGYYWLLLMFLVAPLQWGISRIPALR